MIIGQRKKLAVLTAGLGKYSIETSINQFVDLYLQTTYTGDYDISRMTDFGATVEKVNDYHWRFSHATPGEYTFKLNIVSKDKKIDIKSNPITINVI